MSALGAVLLEAREGDLPTPPLGGFELVALLLCASLLTTPSPEAAVSREAPSTADAASSSASHTVAVAKAEETQAETEVPDMVSDVVSDVVADAEAEEDRRVGSPFAAALRRPAVRLMLLAEAFYGLAGWIPVVHLVRLSMAAKCSG